MCEGLTAALTASRSLPHKRITLRRVLDSPPAGSRAVEFLLTDDLIGSETVRLDASRLRGREEALRAIHQRRADMLDRLLDRIIDGFDLTPLEGVK